VARIKNSHVGKSGQRRDYESVYLRRSYRQDGKVKHHQVANLKDLPEAAISAIEATLAGQTLVPATEAVTVDRVLPHGDVAAVAAMAGKLGLPGLLGPACRERDLAYAMILSRVARPGSKLSTLAWWADTTLGTDLDVAGADTDELYAAMDWLENRQDAIEKTLAARHLEDAETNPHRMALFDLSSSWMEGTCCELAAFGHSRDGKKGRTQIEYGLLTDPDGRPVAVRVVPGNTGDPTAFSGIVSGVRETFGLQDLVMVGDRGMITKARITELKNLNDETDGTSFGWLTALRAPAIAKLAREDGPLQMSLFDQQNLAEISHPDYPGERLIACRNPLLATQQTHKRENLLDATQTDLAAIAARVRGGTLAGKDKIGVELGKVRDRHKVGKYFTWEITDETFTYQRDQAAIDAAAALDGIYVIRTSVSDETLDGPGVVAAYKNLAHVEQDWSIVKADDLDLRPIYHHLTERVKAHVLICMLACYLVWHLRRAWAPLTYTDEHPPHRDDPVAPAVRSGEAQTKASRHRDQHGRMIYSFAGLLTHLATLTRNELRFAGVEATVPTLAAATETQQRAFDLIGASIPLTLA
jgi:hypothetical protein